MASWDDPPWDFRLTLMYGQVAELQFHFKPMTMSYELRSGRKVSMSSMTRHESGKWVFDVGRLLEPDMLDQVSDIVEVAYSKWLCDLILSEA